MPDRATWDRLRAALDGWEAPRGLRLCHTTDERSGRVAIDLTFPCGDGFGWAFAPMATDAALERFIARLPDRLECAAFKLLVDHICCEACEGRPPRLLAYGERAFRRWADRYRQALDARRARRSSPWRTSHG